jgi:predicted transcriptional regulator
MKDNRVTLRFSREMQDQLKDIATDEDRSVSNVIRKAINTYVNTKKIKRTSKV